MIKENRGQISLEYMMIFAVSLIILIAFTMPLLDYTVKNTLDVSDTLDMKNGLSKISQAITQVYGQGQGSKQTVHVTSPQNIKVTVNEKYISCSLKLKDNSKKFIKITTNSNLKNSIISLGKGENSLVVEWPQDRENMIIYRK